MALSDDQEEVIPGLQRHRLDGLLQCHDKADRSRLARRQRSGLPSGHGLDKWDVGTVVGPPWPPWPLGRVATGKNWIGYRVWITDLDDGYWIRGQQ